MKDVIRAYFIEIRTKANYSVQFECLTIFLKHPFLKNSHQKTWAWVVFLKIKQTNERGIVDKIE